MEQMEEEDHPWGTGWPRFTWNNGPYNRSSSSSSSCCCAVRWWCIICDWLQEKCHQYWPTERSARYQYFVVDPTAEYNMPQYILREFKVTDARVGIPLSSLSSTCLLHCFCLSKYLTFLRYTHSPRLVELYFSF